jgi:porin
MRNCIKIIAFLILFMHFTAYSEEKTTENPFAFGATYTGDLVSNLHGGIKTGTNYLGMATINVGFNTESAGWWKNGEAYIKLANTHGGEPSANLIGDFQGVSNIEAGNLSWLYELWYKQTFSSFSLIAGLQDLNVNFASSEYGALFTNSSFGIHSSIADNISSPIFPLTALGVNFQWQINDDFLWEAAVFDGTPDDFENNPYNINWKINETDGFLVVSEVQYKMSLLGSKNGNYKLGAYYHQNKGELNDLCRNYGFYIVADQQITDKLSAFSQIGLSPKALNMHNHFYSLGFNVNTPFRNREDDVFGFAVAYAGIDGNDVGSETAFEMTYKYQICDNLYVRPDMQYIINPAGTDVKLPNALVAFIRLGIEF